MNKMRKKRMRGRKVAPGAKSTYCFWRGLEFCSQHTPRVARYLSVNPAPWDPTLSSMGSTCKCTYSNVYARTYAYILK